VAPKIVGVIPARYASTRFPGKPLALIRGVPMVVRVYRRALESGIFDALLVAADDERVSSLCHDYGVPVCMTRTDHSSGSDRVWEAASGQNADIIVNVQGDEPLLDPVSLRRLIEPLCDPEADAIAVSSVYAPILDPADYANPNVVKLVIAADGRALYFSRAPIPYAREGLPEIVFRHIGLYAYTRLALERFVHMPVSPLERMENLEQLRLLENGIPIFMRRVDASAHGVDTPEDLARIEALLGGE
jgi:3-deoxy-manno-octulosonate cytidylyltransferase (CMP-KDO synthetase)